MPNGPSPASVELLPALQVCEVSRAFEDRNVLQAIDLQVAAGETVAVVGSNGAGKTTLLRVAAGRLRPTAGRIVIGGWDARESPEAARGAVGFVGHRTSLYRHLDLRENLRFFATLHAVDAAEPRIEEVLLALGLAPIGDRRAGVLSRGQAQRLAIARAVVHRPPLLVLDEPFAGLDPEGAARLSDVLRDAVRRGQAVLLSTHDLERAAEVADRVVVLVQGRIRGVLSADERDASAWKRRAHALITASAGGAAAVQATVVKTTVADGPRAAAPNRSEGCEPRVGASGRLPTPARVVRAIVMKDLRLELRGGELLPPSVIFAAVAMIVLGRAFLGTATEMARIGPGVLWVALLLGSTLGISRTLAAEAEQGALDAVLGSPADRAALFVGKWLSAWAFTSVVALVLLPLTVALFRMPVTPLGMARASGLLLLGGAGWTAAGVLVAGAALAARGREILVPILLYPLALPLVLPAARWTAEAVSGGQASWAALSLVAAYALIYVVIGALLFPFVVEA